MKGIILRVPFCVKCEKSYFFNGYIEKLLIANQSQIIPISAGDLPHTLEDFEFHVLISGDLVWMNDLGQMSQCSEYLNSWIYCFKWCICCNAAWVTNCSCLLENGVGVWQDSMLLFWQFQYNSDENKWCCQEGWRVRVSITTAKNLQERWSCSWKRRKANVKATF